MLFAHNNGAAAALGAIGRTPYNSGLPVYEMNTMDDVEAILARATQRALENKLPYAGALLPSEAFTLLRAVPHAAMVDVRTQAEWYWVGRVPGAVMIEWTSYPGSVRNPDFLPQFRSAVPATAAPVMFLCRSGHRSHHAAALATQAGYPRCCARGIRGRPRCPGPPQQHQRLAGGRAALGTRLTVSTR